MKKILGCLLALLGFAGCESITNGGEEYGSPYVEYSVKGEVTNGENALDNVEVKFFHPYYSTMWKSVVTDKVGKYQVQERNSYIGPHDTLKLKVIVDDLSNKYQSDTANVMFLKSDFSGKKKNDYWFEGSAEKTVNFTLKKKDDK